MSNMLLQLGLALFFSVIVMNVMWLIQRRTNNGGIVDVAWAFSIGVVVVALACVTPGEGWRRVLVASLSAIWSVRLGLHLAQRMRREEEDGRYQALREWAGPRQQLVLWIFFMIQATWVVLFSLPQYAALHNTAVLGIFDLFAVLIFATSLIGESISDAQLARFKSQPESKGKTCRVGLWRYSRHPNYFFEWLQWFAYPLFAIGIGPWAWLTLLGPGVMLYFLLKVTGVPPTEARALQSRGDDYRDYQRTTSVFFPWFPSESAT